MKESTQTYDIILMNLILYDCTVQVIYSLKIGKKDDRWFSVVLYL